MVQHLYGLSERVRGRELQEHVVELQPELQMRRAWLIAAAVCLVATLWVGWRLLHSLFPPPIDGTPRKVAPHGPGGTCDGSRKTVSPKEVKSAIERLERAGDGLFETRLSDDGCFLLRQRRERGKVTAWRVYEMQADEPVLRMEIHMVPDRSDAASSLQTLLQEPTRWVVNGWWPLYASSIVTWVESPGGALVPRDALLGHSLRERLGAPR